MARYAQDDIKGCFANPEGCPGRILANLVYSQLSSIIDQYISLLRQQGNGRWRGIPSDITSVVSSQYPQANLNSVRFATGINTVHGQAITVGNEIFFPGDIDLADKDGLKLLFHELEHVEQYAARGGIRPFLAEYIAKIPAKIIQNRSFQIHDDLDIERAAISKSDVVLRLYNGQEIQVVNKCKYKARIAVAYYTDNRNWKITGYWSFDPEERAYLSQEGEGKLHSRNEELYYYAEAENGNVVWTGDYLLEVDTDKRQLKFRKSGDYSLSLTCEGL